MEFLRTEISLTWIAVTLYVICGFLATVGLVFKKEKALRISTHFAWAGLIVHAVPIIMRWVTANHGPYYRIHEVVGSDVWIGVLFFLILTWRYKNLKVIGAFVMPVAFSLLAWATLSDPLIRPLPPTFKSEWLILHIVFAKLSIGSILVAFGLAILYLIKERHQKKSELPAAVTAGVNPTPAVAATDSTPRAKPVTAENDGGVPANASFYDRFPPLERLDDLAYRFVAFGFIFLGVMIVAGSIWAQQAWGRYWSWDPVETWSLVCWFLYGLFLHLRITFKFKGRRSAYLIIGVLVVSLIYHFGTTFITTTIHEGTSF